MVTYEFPQHPGRPPPAPRSGSCARAAAARSGRCSAAARRPVAGVHGRREPVVRCRRRPRSVLPTPVRSPSRSSSASTCAPGARTARGQACTIRAHAVDLLGRANRRPSSRTSGCLLASGVTGPSGGPRARGSAGEPGPQPPGAHRHHPRLGDQPRAAGAAQQHAPPRAPRSSRPPGGGHERHRRPWSARRARPVSPGASAASSTAPGRRRAARCCRRRVRGGRAAVAALVVGDDPVVGRAAPVSAAAQKAVEQVQPCASTTAGRRSRPCTSTCSRAPSAEVAVSSRAADGRGVRARRAAERCGQPRHQPSSAAWTAAALAAPCRTRHARPGRRVALPRPDAAPRTPPGPPPRGPAELGGRARPDGGVAAVGVQVPAGAAAGVPHRALHPLLDPVRSRRRRPTGRASRATRRRGRPAAARSRPCSSAGTRSSGSSSCSRGRCWAR